MEYPNSTPNRSWYSRLFIPLLKIFRKMRVGPRIKFDEDTFGPHFDKPKTIKRDGKDCCSFLVITSNSDFYFPSDLKDKRTPENIPPRCVLDPRFKWEKVVGKNGSKTLLYHHCHHEHQHQIVQIKQKTRASQDSLESTEGNVKVEDENSPQIPLYRSASLEIAPENLPDSTTEESPNLIKTFDNKSTFDLNLRKSVNSLIGHQSEDSAESISTHISTQSFSNLPKSKQSLVLERKQNQVSLWSSDDDSDPKASIVPKLDNFDNFDNFDSSDSDPGADLHISFPSKLSQSHPKHFGKDEDKLDRIQLRSWMSNMGLCSSNRITQLELDHLDNLKIPNLDDLNPHLDHFNKTDVEPKASWLGIAAFKLRNVFGLWKRHQWPH